MTEIYQIIRAAIPDASDMTCEHVLWGRTHFPFAPLSAQYLYKRASGYYRAGKHDIRLCEFCDNRAKRRKFVCHKCDKALRTTAVEPPPDLPLPSA